MAALSDPALLLAICLVAAALAGFWIWRHHVDGWARDLRSSLEFQSRSLRMEAEAFDRHCQERLKEMARRFRK